MRKDVGRENERPEGTRPLVKAAARAVRKARDARISVPVATCIGATLFVTFLAA
jgi:hypothetical protein